MESCISCSRVVSGKQQAVECDVCGKWQHRTCDTGISLKTYREAVKNGGSLTFVCRPCLVKENISEDDDGPPVLELSIPVHNESQDETMIYEQPPLLELSVMLPMTDVTVIFEETNLDEPPTLDTGADMYMIDTILDDSHFQDTSIIEDMYMPEARDEVLQHIKQRLVDISVEGFVVDFEQAAWLAIREVFPGKEVKGCAFHWSQAVWRHVQKVGLAETYRRRLGVHSFIRMLLAVQFLPATHIERAVEGISTRAVTPETRVLLEYMRRQWLNHPVFKVEDWSVYRQNIRTNNDVEGWHHRINCKAGGSSLAFYRLVPLLRREADLVKLAVATGDLERATSTLSRRMDVSITTCWDRYSSGEWKTSRFLQAVGEIYAVQT